MISIDSLGVDFFFNGSENVDKMQKAEKVLSNFIKTVAKIGGVASSMYVVGDALAGFAKRAAGIDEVNKRTGESAETLDAWGRAMRVFGGDANTFNQTVENMSKSITSAMIDGNEEFRSLMNFIGAPLEEFGGGIRQVSDILLDLAEAFPQLDGKMQTRIADGLNLPPAVLKALRGGRTELEALIQTQKDMFRMTDEHAAQGERTVKSWNRIKTAIGAAFDVLAAKAMPVVDAVLSKIADLVEYIVSNKPLLFGVFTGLAALISVTLIPALLRAGKAVLALFKFKVPATALESLEGLLKGAESIPKEGLKPFKKGLISSIVDAFKTAASAALKAAMALGGMIKTALSKSLSGVTFVFKGIGRGAVAAAAGIKNAFLAAGPAVLQFGKAAGSALKNVVLSAGAAAKSVLLFAKTMAVGAVKGVASFASVIATKAIAALSGLAAALYAGAAAALKFGIALLANPIGLVIAGIVALGAAIYLCVKHWDKIKEAVSAAWEYIKSVFVAGWNMLPEWIRNPLEKAAAAISAFGEKIWSGVKADWERIKSAFSAAWDGIVNVAKAFGGMLFGVFSGIWERVSGVFSEKFAAIKDAFGNSFIGGLLEIVRQFNPLSIIIDAFTKIKDWIMSFDLAQAGVAMIKKLGDGILNKWNSIKDEIKNAVFGWVSDTWNSITSIFSGKKEDIDAKFKATVEANPDADPVAQEAATAYLAGQGIGTFDKAPPEPYNRYALPADFYANSPVASPPPPPEKERDTSFADALAQPERIPAPSFGDKEPPEPVRSVSQGTFSPPAPDRHIATFSTMPVTEPVKPLYSPGPAPEWSRSPDMSPEMAQKLKVLSDFQDTLFGIADAAGAVNDAVKTMDLRPEGEQSGGLRPSTGIEDPVARVQATAGDVYHTGSTTTQNQVYVSGVKIEAHSADAKEVASSFANEIKSGFVDGFANEGALKG